MTINYSSIITIMWNNKLYVSMDNVQNFDAVVRLKLNKITTPDTSTKCNLPSNKCTKFGPKFSISPQMPSQGNKVTFSRLSKFLTLIT